MNVRALLSCLLVGPAMALLADDPSSPRVSLQRLPHRGIQPQAVGDADGVAHVVYFSGNPQGGDLFYVRQRAGDEGWSAPMRVNRQPGSAIAVGSIRGAQVVPGRSRRLHVVWNGSQSSGKHRGTPMWYTRLDDSGTSFEPERDLITHAAGLDGGGSVAADRDGNVYVAWHAPGTSDAEGESERAVFIARSRDDGQTFACEAAVAGIPTGTCACCGLRALADEEGNVFVLYRAVTEEANRPATLLFSTDHAGDFVVSLRHPWQIATCPMSSTWLTLGRREVFAAWETGERVFFTRVNPRTGAAAAPEALPAKRNAKHPVLVENARGELLCAWTEGTGWEQGGEVVWQVRDSKGSVLTGGRAEGVPAWGLVAAVAQPDGSFTIFH